MRELVWSTRRFLHRAAAALLRSRLIRLLSSSSGLQLRSLTGLRPPILRRFWLGIMCLPPAFFDKGGVDLVSQSDPDWDNELCHMFCDLFEYVSASDADMY